MSPEFQNPFEKRIGTPTSIILDEKTKYFPISFTLEEVIDGEKNDKVITISTVTSTRTEMERNWKGRPKAEIFNVRTELGTFQLRHNLKEEGWVLVGKLKE